MKFLKILFVALIVSAFALPALTYEPEEIVDPSYSGPKVYRGYIVNTSPDRYLEVEISDENGDVLFADQIAPDRPVRMPYQKWGKGHIPDLNNYYELLEKYYQEHGMTLWIRNILLPVGTFTIKHKWSDEKDWTTSTVVFTQEMMDNAPGPYVLEFSE